MCSIHTEKFAHKFFFFLLAYSKKEVKDNQLEIHGKSMSADLEAANSFNEKFELIIEDRNCDLNVYHADETT